MDWFEFATDIKHEMNKKKRKKKKREWQFRRDSHLKFGFKLEFLKINSLVPIPLQGVKEATLSLPIRLF